MKLQRLQQIISPTGAMKTLLKKTQIYATTTGVSFYFQFMSHNENNPQPINLVSNFWSGCMFDTFDNAKIHIL